MHRVLDAALGGGVEQRVERDDRRLRAFEAEALLADVARVQEPLEDLGGVQPLEQVALLVDARRRRRRPRRGAGSTRFWLGSWMCMYSMPIVRQYASRRIARISWSVAVVAARESVGRRTSRSRSQIERP